MSERSEQRCFEIMNMNDKHSYSLLMRPADFSPEFSAEKIFHNFFQKFFSPEFSAEKIFHNFFFKNFFLQNFQRKNFFKIFFSRIFSGKIFSQFFSPEFSAEKFFHNFFLQNFQRNIFPASLSGTQELNLSGYPFHLTKAFFFFWSRRITFSIRKIF